MGGVHEPKMATALSWLISLWTLDVAVAGLESVIQDDQLDLARFFPSIRMPATGVDLTDGAASNPISGSHRRRKKVPDNGRSAPTVMGEPVDTELEPVLEPEHAAKPATVITAALAIVTIRAEWCLYIATGNISCHSRNLG